MAARKQRAETLNPNTGRSGPRLDQDIYDAVRAAIRQVVSGSADGVLFRELPGRVAPLLPPGLLPAAGSVSWYTTTIKLALEARGLIVRVPGSRLQRLRLCPRPDLS